MTDDATQDFDRDYAEEIATAVNKVINHLSTKADGAVSIKTSEAADALIYVLAGLLASSAVDADTPEGRIAISAHVAAHLNDYMTRARNLIERGKETEDGTPCGKVNSDRNEPTPKS